MNTNDKIFILAKSRRKKRRSPSAGKRNAVPTKSGGRKDVSKKGGGAKAALMRRIHRDPDIQKLLEKNPRYDIIVVKKVQASNALVKSMLTASDNDFGKEQWFEVAKLVKPDYTVEQFDRDWEEFQTLKQQHATQAGAVEEFEAKEQAKKELLQARKDLLVAKRSKDLAQEKKIRARIVELEAASLSEHDKKSLKMHDDWHQEQIRRKQVGGYD